MTLTDVMARLESLGSEKVRAQNARNGASENQFGVMMGDIRKVAKEIKVDPELAKELWNSGNYDARLLATLIMNPKKRTPEEVEQLVRDLPVLDLPFDWLAGWLTSNVVKQNPAKEALRQKWMASDETMLARAGWSLTCDIVEKDANAIDINGLLDRIEAEMGSAPQTLQWTMNCTLASIGIKYPEHRSRALEIGEKLGVFRDYKVSKGCTSPFAPIWINEIVGRQNRI